MSKILMVASEAVPFAKSGGLADVVGALPPALISQGDEVAVVLPRYRGISIESAQRVAENLTIWFGPDSYLTDIYVIAERGVPYFLVDCPSLYDRDNLYSADGADYPDNHVRFAVLCRSALNVARHLYRPQIIHCHDWQGAMVAPYLKSIFLNDPTFLNMKVLMTIHNLGYQGIFSRVEMGQIGLEDKWFTDGTMEFDGDVNYLKAGILLADAITTVSPSYAREIQTSEYGCKLEGLLAARSDDLTGILNGVDYEDWDPATDSHIAANYTPNDLSDKQLCKQDLLHEFGLPEDDLETPVIGIVSRFTAQKGFDLLEGILDDLAGEELRLVALGTGEPHYEEFFRGLAERHPGRIAVRIAYDNTLAHKIEAGADMFLMPSRYEPCGLNQIYSLKYGTIPIVRATGGLDDSIDAQTGFKFWGYIPNELYIAIRAALDAYQNPKSWKKMMLAAMSRDFSWTTSAAQYSKLYQDLLS
jgi:starch synthase